MTNEQKMILVAADDVQSLRKSDVYRVIDEALVAYRLSTAQYIARERPDLEQECKESLIDLGVI